MLAIPVLSSECERIFSSAKLLLTASRNRLLPNIIEANECLRAWFRDEEVERKQGGQDGLSGEGGGEARDEDWGSCNESDEESGEESDEGNNEENNEQSDEESHDIGWSDEDIEFEGTAHD